MTNGWLASPTLSVVVEVIFSLPHFRVASSSLRTGRSMIAVITTSALPGGAATAKSFVVPALAGFNAAIPAARRDYERTSHVALPEADESPSLPIVPADVRA